MSGESEDLILITFSWDSGPFGTYWEAGRDAKVALDRPRGYGKNTVPVPRVLWERYRAAEEEFEDARDALDAAERSALDELRKSDPRWVAWEKERSETDERKES